MEVDHQSQLINSFQVLILLTITIVINYYCYL